MPSSQNWGLPVPETNDTREAEFKQVSETLTEGLKTCHAVVESYRVVLSGCSAGAGGAPPVPESRSLAIETHSESSSA